MKKELQCEEVAKLHLSLLDNRDKFVTQHSSLLNSVYFADSVIEMSVKEQMPARFLNLCC